MRLKILLFIVSSYTLSLVSAQAPLISSFNPATACPGTNITIKGINFKGVTTVSIGGVAATSFTVNSDSNITAVSGNSSNGLIKITNTKGTGISPGIFSVGSSSVAYAFITDSSGSNVSVINTASNTVVSTIPVGNTPIGVCTSPDGTKAYIVNQHDNNIYVINTYNYSRIAVIYLSIYPYSCAMSPDGSKLYVVQYLSNVVSVINTSTNTVTNTITVGANPLGIAVSPNGSRAYVTNFSDNSISVINTTSNTVSTTFKVGASPKGVVLSPDGSKLYVANFNSNTLSVINTANNSVTRTIATGTGPWGVAMSPDGSKVYVSNFTSGTVSVVNTLSNLVTSTVNVGINPEGLSVSPDGSSVYAANNGSNTVSIINTTSNTVTSTIPSGSNPAAFGNFIANVVIPCPPTISSFTPSSGGAGTIVNITGTNFLQVTSVSIGGVPALSYTVNSASSITAIVSGSGAHGTDSGRGSGSVVLTTLGGTASMAGFTYTYPILKSFTPKYACPGASISISGYNFTGATAIILGGVTAKSFIVNSDTSITAVVGSGGYGPVTVTNAKGSDSSSIAIFEVGGGTALYAYVLNNSSSDINGTISVINIATNTVVKTINVGRDPRAICFSPDGSKLYFTDFTRSTLKVMSTKSDLILNNIFLSGFYNSPTGLVTNLDGSKLYVSDRGSNNMYIINTITNTVKSTINIGYTEGIAISPDGSKVYVSNSNKTVNVINTSSDTVIATIPVGSIPKGIVVSPDGSTVYVANYDSNKVTVINTSSNTVTYTIKVGINPWELAITPDGSKLYVTNYTDGTVSVINTSNNTVVKSVFVGGFAAGLSITPDGSKVYVANYLSRVSVISTLSNTVISNITVGSGPISIGNFITNLVVPCTPTISSFTPTSGGSGTTITITGTNLTTTGSVSFGGVPIPVALFTVNSDTSITAIVSGSGATGAVSLSTNGGAASLAGFTYTSPIVSSFSSKSACPGSKINIVGSNFTGATSVILGNVPARSFTVNSDTSITALVGGSGNGLITVTTANGSGSSKTFFGVGGGIAPYAYVPNNSDGTVSVIDISNNSVKTTINFGKGSDPVGQCHLVKDYIALL